MLVELLVLYSEDTQEEFYMNVLCVEWQKNPWEKNTTHTKTELTLYYQYPTQGLWIRPG